MSVLSASGQLFEERTEAAAPVVVPGGGGFTGGLSGFGGDAFAQHTGISSWVKIDTTALWSANGGDVATGTHLTIDGTDASTFGYTQPTPGSPVVVYLMIVGTRTIQLGAHTASFDVIWRGYPWKARVIGAGVSTDYHPAWAGVGDVIPSAANGYADGSPWQSVYAINNGYSIVIDATGTSAVFCVAPGDQPSHNADGTGIQDTRSEFTMGETFSDRLSGSGIIAGSPLGTGIDYLGSRSATPRFLRCDFQIPATWDAPIVVQNSNGSYAFTEQGGNNGRGAWPLIPGAATQKPISQDKSSTGNPHVVGTLDYPIDQTVRNSTLDPADAAKAITSFNLSNLNENYGPATITWASPQNPLQPSFRLNLLTMGVFLPVKRVDTFNVVFDQRLSTIVEIVYDICSTSDGVPYVVPPGTTSPLNGGAAWSATHPVNPPGPPPGVAGGAYVRFWRRINDAWTCVSAGHQWAVPGTPTIVDGAIVGDPVTGADAGKIYCSNMKTTAATLASGPSGSSGTVLSSAATPPFNISVANIVHSNPHNTGGVLWLGNERMTYSSYDSTTKTLTVNARAVGGSSALDHALNEQAIISENWPTLNPGVNAQVALPVPLAVRWWPVLSGPTFDSVAGDPAASYP